MEHCYKTFVSIGNGKQSFIRLLNAIEDQHDILPRPALIQHGHTTFSSAQYQLVDFVNMDQFIRHINDAEILILHAGAGSVMNAIKAGKRPIIMPRIAKCNEVVNDHQIGFAKILHSEGKALMVENAMELRLAIKRTLEEGAQLSQGIHQSRAIKIISERLSSLLSA